MIWIIGEYADRIDGSRDLLDGFVDNFKDEPAEVRPVHCNGSELYRSAPGVCWRGPLLRLRLCYVLRFSGWPTEYGIRTVLRKR